MEPGGDEREEEEVVKTNGTAILKYLFCLFPSYLLLIDIQQTHDNGEGLCKKKATATQTQMTFRAGRPSMATEPGQPCFGQPTAETGFRVMARPV